VVASVAGGLLLMTLVDGRAVAPASARQGADYSRFEHLSAHHARLECLLCHRRETNAATPKLPGHTPSAGCHQPQFASPGPFCAICHTQPGAAALKRFPRLKTFDVAFDHATHARGAARPRQDCKACHKPLRQGVALAIPAGFSAHTTCFQCHTPRATARGRDISSCGACHRVGQHVRTPTTARAFSMNFSHAEHARAGLSCAACHDVLPGRPRGTQVTSPVPAQHHAPARARSCMTCHDGTRAFGGDDFSACKRCHEGDAWHF
jgi:c(7)-type cytochrome triheme protein